MLTNMIAATIIQALQPLLMAVITIGAGYIAKQVGKYVGLKNEKLVRDALHQSAENGLKFAIARGVPEREILNTAAQYVKEMSPDTVKRSGVNPSELKDIIRTKTVPPAVSG